MGIDDVREHVAIRRARPTLKELRARFPNARYREWKDALGKTQWKLRVPLDNQKDRSDLIDMEMPSARMETERSSRLSAQTPRVEVLDSWGRKCSLDARFADGVIRDRAKSGVQFRPVMRVRGVLIERGMDGMLYRLEAKGWQATGRWCLTSPWRPGDAPVGGEPDGSMRLEGIQRDPDGGAWMPIEGRWVEVT